MTATNARVRMLVIGLVALVGVLLVRHVRGARGKKVAGGILVGDARLYDAVTHRLLLGSLFRRIAADVASVATPGAKVLEVGCGPGHLSLLLAREHGLDVTGVDLDPAMIERACINAAGSAADASRPGFLVGDVASLDFPDDSFDLVVTTLSMHHWDDPVAGLAEIARVLRPEGRVLIWDLRPGHVPLHSGLPDPATTVRRSPLTLVSAGAWRWPWRLAPLQRLELAAPA